MLWPLLVLTLATKLYYIASLCRRARVDLLALEGNKAWVRELVAAKVAP
jgi:heme exporter protein C